MVFGVPFQLIPFKANSTGPPPPAPKRHHVRGMPEKANLEISFPRVEGYAQEVRNRITLDWDKVPSLALDPLNLSPYYGWLVEILREYLQGDTTAGEAPELPLLEQSRGAGSTSDVDFWTGKDVREVVNSHLNYVVADTKQWEQSAAYLIDTHPRVEAFVKNAGLGFGIPYFNNGEPHEFIPDFVIRFKNRENFHLILETKG